MAKMDGLDPWELAVYVMIRNTRGKVLLLRRAPGVKHFPGCWELPGGKPAPGENFAKTAELEVDEEAGLYVVPSGVAGAVEGSVPGIRVALLVLEARTTRSKVTLSREHDAFCWIEPARVSSLQLRPGFDEFFASYTGRQSPKRVSKGQAARPSNRSSARAQ